MLVPLDVDVETIVGLELGEDAEDIVSVISAVVLVPSDVDVETVVGFKIGAVARAVGLVT